MIAGEQIWLGEHLGVATRRLRVDKGEKVLRSEVGEKRRESCGGGKDDIPGRLIEDVIGVENPGAGPRVSVLVAIEAVDPKFVDEILADFGDANVEQHQFAIGG